MGTQHSAAGRPIPWPNPTTRPFFEAARQLQGRAGKRQLPRCELAYANGTGGMLAEQVALVLEGA